MHRTWKEPLPHQGFLTSRSSDFSSPASSSSRTGMTSAPGLAARRSGSRGRPARTEFARRRLFIPPCMATVLTARLSRPLSKLPGKTLSFPDRENGSRCVLQFYSTSSVPVGPRTYADAVNPVGNKAVLVTGCDSGFGFSLAKRLHSEGFRVFAGCLSKDKGDIGAKELDSLRSDRLRTVRLNVCKSEEVEKVVEIVHTSLEAPEKGTWGLVNKAGISAFGEVEFTSMENYKEVAEANLWGTVRVTKSFLPLIRRAKGECLLSSFVGCIVNIRSMLDVASPARNPCTTKFGVEAFSACLRCEMHPLGVKVCVVEPGNFMAAMSLYSPECIQAIADKMRDELPEVVCKGYGKKYFDEKTATMQTYCNSGSTDRSPVIDAVTHALTAAKPYTRCHPMDYYRWLRMQIRTHLPGAVSDRIYVHKSFQLASARSPGGRGEKGGRKELVQSPLHYPLVGNPLSLEDPTASFGVSQGGSQPRPPR
ncbi:LOW QUALITY PROTEIN: D-beta-hydroxybutyrate dehydrogenase, mitochondrial [Glossophaga mutica]